MKDKPEVRRSALNFVDEQTVIDRMGCAGGFFYLQIRSSLRFQRSVYLGFELRVWRIRTLRRIQ